VLRIFSNRQKQIQDFIFVLENFTNIAVVNTSRFENSSVKEILKDLESYILKFYQLKKTDPNRYTELLESYDFFDKKVQLRSRTPTLDTEGIEQVNLGDVFKNREEYIVFQNFRREQRLSDVFLNTFYRIWNSAITANNQEISRYCVYHLEYILARQVIEDNNADLIDKLLNIFNQITYELVTRFKEIEIDPSVYPSSIHWYTEIVFNRLGQDGEEFKETYLHLFDKHLFMSAKIIISNGRFDVFRHLVSMLVDGISISSYGIGRIWDYGHLIMKTDFAKYKEIETEHQIETKLKQLDKLARNISDVESLNQSKSLFDKIKKILEPNFNIQQTEYSRQIEEDILDAFNDQVKYRSLLEVAFAIGSYCLFKQESDFIRYMWEYKQPPDSDATWSGHDITPNTIDKLMKFYFGKGFFDRRSYSWDEHHGQELYIRRYFILVLARVIKYDSRLFEPEQFNQNKFRFLSDINIYRLQDVKFLIPDFISTTLWLIEHEDLLKNLGFTDKDIRKIFSEDIIKYMQELKSEVEEEIKRRARITEPSRIKIREFKEHLIEAFREKCVFRKIFKYFGLYIDRSYEANNKLNRFGINQIDDKAAFFDEWYAHYRDWGKHYGGDLAQSENGFLYAQIVSNCKNVNKETFHNVLSSFENKEEVIILATHILPYKFEEFTSKVVPKNVGFVDTVSKDIIDEYYNDIPVIRIIFPGMNDRIIILNRTQLGYLIQYSPISTDEYPEFINDMFYMSIEAFSDNKKLLDDMIEESPNWLKEIGDKEQQKNYLLSKVWIRIFEKFELKLSPDFEGYVIKLPD